MPKKKQEKQVELPVEWYIPDDIVARYATNMVVQRSENEFIISFFEIKPPIFLGTPEEIAQQVKKLNSMRANCVAQVIVAADKMPRFVEVLGINLARNSNQEEESSE